MPETQNPTTDLQLNPAGEPALQRETPHGLLRTLLHVAADKQVVPAQLNMRYNEQQLVLVLVLGTAATALADKTVDWLWQDFPVPEVEAPAFSSQVYDYLQSQARTVGESNDAHSLVIGAITRTVTGGRIWLAWLGTAGVRAINTSREILPIEKGLIAGEGWSPQQGVVPERLRPHAEVLTVNAVDRLLIFSNALRPAIDEIPFLGRAALQRVGEAHAADVPALLFDLHPYQVVPLPDAVSLRYRWENPYEATLLWTGSANATGYWVQQDTTPLFEHPTTIAELVDARQKLYRVQPPPGQEVYYRVVPIAENSIGQPSQPVMVTPVPLVTPYLEPVLWLATGAFRLTWSPLPQANSYELEASPDPEFDNPQTTVLYQGESTTFETAPDFPGGWYFRVRSLNTHFAPKMPSLWSNAQRAPERLTTPTFTQISTASIQWTPVAGATQYEVRDMEDLSLEIVEAPHFTPPRPSMYQVRALRSEKDNATASEWSQGIAVGDSKLFIDTTAKIVMEDTRTKKLGVHDSESTAELPSATTKPRPRPSAGNVIWRTTLIVAALTLGAGLIIGLIGGPRLGIGLDPTATPLKRSEREATATQLVVFVDSATQSVLLDQELKQVQAAGTEKANAFNNETNRNATLTADLADQRATATVSAAEIDTLQGQQATAVAQIDALEQTATQSSDANATLSTDLSNSYLTATADASTIESLRQTATQSSAENSTLTANLDNQYLTATADANIIAGWEQIATQSSAANATLDAHLSNQYAAATVSANQLQGLQQTATQSSNSNATLVANLNDQYATATANAGQISDLEEQVTAAADHLATVQADLENQRAIATTSADQIAILATREADAGATVQALSTSLDASNTQIESLTADLGESNAAIADAQSTVTAQAGTITVLNATLTTWTPTPTPTFTTTLTPTATSTEAPALNILEVAAARPDLTTFVAAINRIGLENLLTGNDLITVFAPSDDAFDSNPELVNLLTGDVGLAQRTLRYHIVPGRYTLAELQDMDGETLITLEGHELTITVVGDTVMVNGIEVIESDFQASNGLVHIISGILTLPEASPNSR